MLKLKQISLMAVLPLTLIGFTVAAQSPVKLPDTARLLPHEASGDVYKLLSENQHFRVLLATWKPGQSDEWHTHGGNLVNFNLTDCQLKGELPDGRMAELVRKKDAVGFNTPDTHKVTNVGKSDCVLLIVERKG
jgi:hypothetical protein